jgi:ABC-type phosphate transport system substrate-binding protein
MAVRTDGASVDIDGDYTETLARLDRTPANGIGVFGLAFYENNTDKLQGRHHVGRYAVDRNHRFGRIPGVAPAVLLHQEGAYRRDPRA